MKTVLIFSPTVFMGGAETNLVRMCRYLTKNGYQCVVVLPPEGNLGQLCEEIGAKTVCLSAKKLQSGQLLSVLWNCIVLDRCLKENGIHKIDVIHSNSMFALYLPVYYAWFRKKHCFIHWADFDIPKGDRQLLNLFHKHVTVFAVSDSIKAFLTEHKVKSETLHKLYYGIEEPVVKEISSESFISKYGMAPTHYRIGITGRIDSWKGHTYLIKALAKFKDKPISLVIMGDYYVVKNPNIEQELKALIESSGIQHQIIFTGYTSNPLSIVSHLDCVIIPSDYEPFGLVAIEAMALKKPVIASRTGGLAEIIFDKETGYLVPPKSAEGLAEKIGTMMALKDGGEALGEAGYKRFKSEFHIDRFISRLMTAYEKKMT